MTTVPQRRIGIVTSFGKTYSGLIDIPNENLRTTDLLNSANLFWKDPNERCLEDAILLRDAKLLLDETAVYKRFNKLQIKLAEIIFFYDDFKELGNELEQTRARQMRERTNERSQMVNIITPIIANSFYDITGTFFGQFKKKTQDKFVPLSNVTISEIHKKNDKWQKKNLNLPFDFAGISPKHIESLSMEFD